MTYAVYTKNDGKYYRATMNDNISPCLRLTDELTERGLDCVIVQDEVKNLLSTFDALPKIIMEFKGINGY
jgi:hypothetical protein